MSDDTTLPFASAAAPLAARIRQRKQPIQARSRATVAILQEAAIQVLRRDGYAALTTTAVAARAGVSVGTLYQYYPDKASLITALKARYFEGMLEAVRTALAATPPPAPPAARLRAGLAALLRFKADSLDLAVGLRPAFDDVAAAGHLEAVLAPFARLLQTALTDRQPASPDLAWRAGLLTATLERAVTHTVWTAPERLADPATLDALCAMASGLLDSSPRAAD
ncbi:MAG: TetR/AcrR family transcriptional regulator [Reyranellaceae bacterium]